jgi:hypothetical protein
VEIQSSGEQKIHLDKSKGKIVLEVFFDAQGLVHYEDCKKKVKLSVEDYRVVRY